MQRPCAHLRPAHPARLPPQTRTCAAVGQMAHCLACQDRDQDDRENGLAHSRAMVASVVPSRDAVAWHDGP